MKLSFLCGVLLALVLPAAAEAMNNPATYYCESVGGRPTSARLPSRQTITLCILPDQMIIEEWSLFRMQSGGRRPIYNPPVLR